MNMFTKRLKPWGESKASLPESEILQMISNCTPWPPVDADPEDEFDPMQPKLSMIEGAPSELGKVFKNSVVESVFAPLLHEGECARKLLVSVCRRFLAE